MKKFAMVFPGQGSQAVGMLADLANKHQTRLAMIYGTWFNKVQQKN